MKKNKICPTWVKAAILFAAISIIVYFTAVNFHSFADLVNSTVSVAIRIFMSSLTYIFPFSVFELLIISLLPTAVLLTVISVKQRGKGAEPMRVIFSLFGIVSLLFSSYVFMLGVGYRTTPLADRIGIEDGEDGDAHVGEDGEPHGGDAECRQDEYGHLHTDGEDHVLTGNTQGTACNTDSKGDLRGFVVHQHHVGSLDGGIRA